MAAKLWDKGYELDPSTERFTIGNDHVLDQNLAEYDVLGSLAHAKMLASIGILSQEDLVQVETEVRAILALSEAGKFEITQEQEDVHTAVEEALVEKLGDLGKKIHTARSRNDQVLLDIRLYTRDRLLEILDQTLATAGKILLFAKANEFVPMPGRSHTQRAMPSSVGTWASSFVESLLDNVLLVQTAYALNNQCPLGSAAGYGTCLPIDRQLTSNLLGFEKVQSNVLYVQNSRGKMEAITAFALSQILDDLARLSGDTILFSIPELGYFTLPDELCPGSSIMPQKKNPDPLELVRAKAASVSSLVFRISSVVRNLPSGYNRDAQEIKGALMEAFETASGCISIIGRVFEGLKVNKSALKKSFSSELFAADAATRLAAEGVPFRDAYKKVAAEIKSLKAEDPTENVRSKAHIGAPGALALDALTKKIDEETQSAQSERKRIDQVLKQLASG